MKDSLMSVAAGSLRSSLSLALVLSGSTFAALHWRGIPLSPDGWAYWQAAFSLANGAGYRDFSGSLLTAWPPLYPIYLSLWVRVLGATGLALIAANGLLVILQSIVWLLATRRIWYVEREHRYMHAALGIAAYIALYVPLTFQAAHSANLGLLCAAVMILATWMTSQSLNKQNQYYWLAISITAATLSLLSHNVNLALVAGCASALLITRRNALRDLAVAAGLLIVPIAVWLAVRWYLGQLGSHPVGIGIANFSAMQYVEQMAFVVGNLMVPSAFGLPFLASSGLLAWCVWALLAPTKYQCSPAVRFTAALVLISCGSTLFLFSFTSVTDPIGARFVGWVPVIIVPALFIYASRQSFAALIVVAAISLAPNIHRIAVFAAIHAVPHPTSEIGVLFPIGALISPKYIHGPPVQTNQGLLVAPPR